MLVIHNGGRAAEVASNKLHFDGKKQHGQAANIKEQMTSSEWDLVWCWQEK